MEIKQNTSNVIRGIFTEKNVIPVPDFIAEVTGAVEIAISPLLIGIISGIVLYANWPVTVALIIAVILALTGLVAGIMLARHAWKNKGTIAFLARIAATPELDDTSSNNPA
ncbi:hypothetical protein ACTHGU_03565 [Chitinophagaceae bacterium MMS25-I14]